MQYVPSVVLDPGIVSVNKTKFLHDVYVVVGAAGKIEITVNCKLIINSEGSKTQM